MKLRSFLPLSCLLPVFAMAAAQEPVTDPRIGNWVEEKVSGSYPHSDGLRISVDDLANGLIRYTIRGFHVEGRCDGGKYPYVDANGKPDGRTMSCRVTGPKSVESIGTLPTANPATTFTLVETVSDDGNAMTGLATYRDANGEFVREVRRRFQRRP